MFQIYPFLKFFIRNSLISLVVALTFQYIPLSAEEGTTGESSSSQPQTQTQISSDSASTSSAPDQSGTSASSQATGGTSADQTLTTSTGTTQTSSSGASEGTQTGTSSTSTGDTTQNATTNPTPVAPETPSTSNTEPSGTTTEKPTEIIHVVKPNPRKTEFSSRNIVNPIKRCGLKLSRETYPQKSKDCWCRNIEFGMSTASGNSDIMRYNAGLTLSKEDEKNYILLKMIGRYGESNDVKDTDNTLYNAKYEYNISQKVYTSFDAEIYHDSISELSYRNRYNVSLGRYLVSTECFILQAEAGPGYLQEEKAGEKNEFLAGRLGYSWEWLMVSNVILRQAGEYIADTEDTGVYYTNFDFGLETFLRSYLSIKMDLSNRYDSTPAPGKENNDLFTTTSLNIKF